MVAVVVLVAMIVSAVVLKILHAMRHHITFRYTFAHVTYFHSILLLCAPSPTSIHPFNICMLSYAVVDEDFLAGYCLPLPVDEQWIFIGCSDYCIILRERVGANTGKMKMRSGNL